MSIFGTYLHAYVLQIVKKYDELYRITHWFGLLDGNQNDHLSPQFFFLWDLWHTKGQFLLRFWNVLVLVLVLTFASIFID